MNASLSDAVLPTPDASTPAASLFASVQSCDTSCRFAHPLADPIYADDWLWCTRPGRINRLARTGPDCPRYRPAAHRFDHGE